jgi:dTMP kinase
MSTSLSSSELVDARSESESESDSCLGMLIVVEGIDKSGKTTFVQKLVDYFEAQGREVIVFKFPDRTTETGKQLDHYLKGSQYLWITHMEAVQLFVENRREKKSYIELALKQNMVVICDRYRLSGRVYAHTMGHPYHSALQMDEELPEPTFTFIMMPPMGTCLMRLNKTKRLEITEKDEDNLRTARSLFNFYGCQYPLDRVYFVEDDDYDFCKVMNEAGF